MKALNSGPQLFFSPHFPNQFSGPQYCGLRMPSFGTGSLISTSFVILSEFVDICCYRLFGWNTLRTLRKPACPMRTGQIERIKERYM